MYWYGLAQDLITMAPTEHSKYDTVYNVQCVYTCIDIVQ